MVRAFRSVRPVLVSVPLLAALASVPGTVPDDVAAWFWRDAAGAVEAVVEGLEAGPPAGGVTVGEPRALHLWSEEFRAGAQTDSPVVPLEQWLAPYSVDGTPTGSVVAWRDDGVVTFASADDHVALAAALDDVPAGAIVVHEPVLGAHFALVGGTVTTLVPGFYEGAREAAVETFQAALAEQVDGLLGAAVPEAGDRWWVPVTWGVLAATAAAGLAIALLLAWRRAGHT